MIHVIATIQIAPGRRPEFLKIFNANVPAVRAEDGCLAYEPTIDIATEFPRQIPLLPDAVTVVEQWESLDHLRAHLAAPHMAAYREAVKDLVISVSLQVLEAAG